MKSEATSMKGMEQFVTWRWEERDGEKTKVPYSPHTGARANVADRGTWAGYAEAVAAREERGHDGVGFVSTDSDPFCGVDLDRCVDPDTGEVEAWPVRSSTSSTRTRRSARAGGEYTSS